MRHDWCSREINCRRVADFGGLALDNTISSSILYLCSKRTYQMWEKLLRHFVELLQTKEEVACGRNCFLLPADFLLGFKVFS